jgi:hypothetical protein
MTSRLPGEFSIIINGREIVKVGGVRTKLMPSLRQGLWTTAKLFCMGAEVQLMETYRSLCNPAEEKEWPRLIKDEVVLREAFHREIKGKVTAAVSGGAQPVAIAIIDEFEKSPDFVRLSPPGGYRPQYISALPLWQIRAMVKKPLQTNIDDPGIPVDTRLRRLTVFSADREPLAYVYNAATYDLIPYSAKSGGRVVSTYVRARFLLVEIWTALLLYHKGVLKGQTVAKMSDTLVKQFTDLFAKPVDVGVNYMGELEDEVIAIKRASKVADKPYYPYSAFVTKK